MSSGKFRSLQDMFGSDSPVVAGESTEKKREIQDIPLGELYPYPKRSTFKPYTDQKLQELANSIKENGVYSPVHVRPRPAGGFELIAGHNRWEASKLADNDTIPAIILELDDDTADILFVESNLKQRDEISVSERAKAYRLQYEAQKRQGRRTDLAADESNGKRLLDEMAEGENITGITIFRYVRLGHLCDDLLDLVDIERFGVAAGVMLSYMDKPSQQEVAFYLQAHDKVKITLDNAKMLREMAQDHTLNAQVIAQVLNPPAADKPKKFPSTIKIPTKRIRAAFAGNELEELDDTALVELVIKALFAYQSNEMEELNE